MADVFGEVDEQLRSQQLESFLRRAWPYAAAAAAAGLIGALGVWGWGQHEISEDAKASIAYQAALDSAAKGELGPADRGFAALSASAPPAYRALALMQQAQIRLEQKKTDEAIRLLDQAAKAAPDPIMGDAARLKAAWLSMDAAPLPAVEARLTPLTGPKSPYRALALEALAMARLQGGRFEEAKSDFQVLGLTQDVSQTAQERAHAASDMIQSGAAKDLPAAVKAALALPPQSAPSGPPPGALVPQAGAAQ